MQSVSGGSHAEQDFGVDLMTPEHEQIRVPWLLLILMAFILAVGLLVSNYLSCCNSHCIGCQACNFWSFP